MMDVIEEKVRNKSTSSWGRELKCQSVGNLSYTSRRPLREVVSWNACVYSKRKSQSSRPLREVVSWNISEASVNVPNLCRPLREVVSWNTFQPISFMKNGGRPLREVVSWNTMQVLAYSGEIVDLFVRSWVEISFPDPLCSGVYCRPLREVVSWNIPSPTVHLSVPCRPLREVVSWNNDAQTEQFRLRMVDLFVRSWVEIAYISRILWQNFVDLFVRSWVEILNNVSAIIKGMSTSSWGRELKYRMYGARI